MITLHLTAARKLTAIENSNFRVNIHGLTNMDYKRALAVFGVNLVFAEEEEGWNQDANNTTNDSRVFDGL